MIRLIGFKILKFGFDNTLLFQSEVFVDSV